MYVVSPGKAPDPSSRCTDTSIRTRIAFDGIFSFAILLGHVPDILAFSGVIEINRRTYIRITLDINTKAGERDRKSFVSAADQEKNADDDQNALHQYEKYGDNVNHEETRLEVSAFDWGKRST
jgi:hypothetical protein